MKVETTQVGDKAYLTVGRVTNAKDYRIYEIPSSSALSTDADGKLHVQGGIFRCAGQRPGPGNTFNDVQQHPNGGSASLEVSTHGTSERQPFQRTDAEALLGYASQTPGASLTPLYVLTSSTSGYGCYGGMSEDSWVKKYTTSASERAELLQAGWRDDGILGYVPDPARQDAGVVQIYHGNSWGWQPYAIGSSYLVAGSTEFQARGLCGNPSNSSCAEPVFKLFGSPSSLNDLIPVYRAFIGEGCSSGTDVLALGQADFDALKATSSPRPSNDLTWSGLSGPTTLVVEALDAECPYQGDFAANSVPAVDNPGISYPQWLNLSELSSGSPYSEAFINGQGAPTTMPKPIARTIITLSPVQRDNFDFIADFRPGTTSAAETFVAGTSRGWGQEDYSSQNFNASFYASVPGKNSLKVSNGQLWTAFADIGADVNGKLRLTPKQSATVSDTSFLHISFDTSELVSARRYAQVIVSDQAAPVQENLPSGNSVVFENLGDWPGVAVIQVCDHRTWDVNNQCPGVDPKASDLMIGGKAGHLPYHLISDRIGLDNTRRLDHYLSTTRAFTFVDGKPFLCVDLPVSGAPKAGPVTVTFGDVLYHSGADSFPSVFSNYLKQTAQQIEAHIRMDKLAFKSGVPPPEWDFNRFPCLTKFQ